MAYIDGFVQAVPTASKLAYMEHVLIVDEVFREYGATRLVECWGDEVPDDGALTSFPMAVECRADETVVFSWLWWPSKAVRDEGLPAAMQDERLSAENNPMPFDASRTIHGGFEVLIGD